jgi:hypothetical protein
MAGIAKMFEEHLKRDTAPLEPRANRRYHEGPQSLVLGVKASGPSVLKKIYSTAILEFRVEKLYPTLLLTH